MKTLDVQARLEYARAAVVVLRALKMLDATMSYQDFAIAIGVVSETKTWRVWHKNQITVILNLTAAAEKQGRSRGTKPLEFKRLVTAAARKPGAGFYRTSKIVTRIST